MHKALKEIKESISQVDILIEVLDAQTRPVVVRKHSDLNADTPIFVPLPRGRPSQSYEVVVRQGNTAFKKRVVFRAGRQEKVAVKL